MQFFNANVAQIFSVLDACMEGIAEKPKSAVQLFPVHEEWRVEEDVCRSLHCSVNLDRPCVFVRPCVFLSRASGNRTALRLERENTSLGRFDYPVASS